MEFNKILYVFPSNLADIMAAVSDEVKNSVYEIRLRCDKPIVFRTSSGARFLRHNGQLTPVAHSDCVRIGSTELEVVFGKLCEQSLYSYENTIKNGYIPMRSGCRAGICGDFSDSTYNLRNISSLNLRIAHEASGCDGYIYKLIGAKPKSVLIAGPPGSGKTTVLRELSRRYSDMQYNVCMLDERGELAGMYDSKPAFDVGLCTDVISFREKSDASKIAVKYMCPDIISFDELADDSEIMKQCEATGVKIFTTVHAESMYDTHIRLNRLGISRDRFDLIAVLSNNRSGELVEFIKRDA